MKRLLKFAACLAFAPFFMLSCEEQEPIAEVTNTLEVTPSDPISFLASGNAAVTLTVTTDADSWDYTAPEWIVATQEENTLSVNAKDNPEASRVGRIEFIAGNAEPVTVTVMQEEGSGSQGGDKGGASIVDTGNEGPDVELSVEYTSLDQITDATAEIKVVMKEAVAEEVTVTLGYDAAYLNEFKLTHDDMECELFPEAALKFSSNTLTVPAGQTESTPVTVTMVMDAEGVASMVTYLVPVYVESAEGAEVASDDSRVNYLVKRSLKKEVKNVVYFEVNDTNPMNAIEYLLEDGTPFFDAVILFAGNINYNSTDDLVYLSNNPNVTALLENSETYLQPLRKKGIKVYLGLLGNHDAAGLAQLSDWGARQFAAEVAAAVLEYKIDGVNLDDEYSSYPDLDNPWFTSPSAAAGSRLCYELKKAFDETVPWETEVSVFQYGSIWSLTSVDGVEPGEFVDFWVANYGGSTSPAAGMSYKQCSYLSIECNLGGGLYGATEERARSAKESGYGWCMWFAFDPSGSGSIRSNYSSSFNAMSNTARGLYDMELLTPTGVWHKIGEGQYDPERHPFGN